MATLKDIAREAGVSVMTVSNVINGNTQKVSAETAKRVQEIIDRLHYVPSAPARSLKRSSNIIAIILRGDADQNALSNPHNAVLIGTIINKIQQLGYYSMVNIMKSEADITQSLQTWNVEGAIFLGMFDDEIESMFKSIHIPIVFVDSYSNVRQLSNVGIDDYKGGRLAAQCFLSHGHEKLAFIGPPAGHIGVVQQRLSGFRDELNENGLSVCHQFVVHSDVNIGEIDQLGQQIAAIRDEITGVFVSSDQIASFLINSLRKCNIRIPQDISLIGFDNLLVCQQLTPPLTTISQDLTRKAELAVEILFRKKKSPNAPAEALILDVNLVERASVSDR